MEDSENQEPVATFIPDSPPSRRRVLIPIVVILVVVVGALMAVKASVQKETRLALQPVELSEGATLPNFQLNTLDGNKLLVGDLKHKVMLVNFWATWCEACMEEMPSMVALREQYQSKGFEILGINVDENPNQVVPGVAKKLGIKFPIFTDKNNALAEMFDVHAIPLSVVIDSDRKILMVEPGAREWNSDDIHQMLDKWLAN